VLQNSLKGVRGSDCQPLTIMPKGSIINSCNVDYQTVYIYIMGIVVSHMLTKGFEFSCNETVDFFYLSNV
jgi:hypothetical protein